MKRFYTFAAVLTLSVMMLLSGSQNAFAGEVNWKHFSKNLVMALKSDNTGLRHSAMCLVIKYGEKLEMDEAVFDVMHVFRGSDNQKERQLALVTLYKMNNTWAMDFLARHLKFEKNETIKWQIAAMLYTRQQGGDVNLVIDEVIRKLDLS